MTTLTLSVGGNRLEGWKSVTVSRGIEQLAGSYEVTCADRWALDTPPQQPPPLKGQPARVQIAGVDIITGHINRAAPNYRARQHDLIIAGRDAAGDLVDSCARTDGSGWVGRSLKQIAVSLVQPFGIKIKVDASAGRDADTPFLHQHLQIGETIHEALMRLARIRGLLLISDGLGNLVITRTGSGRASTALVLGENVLEADAEESDEERFNEYRVIGQARESDDNAGARAQQIGETVFDPAVRKGRLLIIDPQDAADIGACRQLASWTRSVRAARGARVTYTVHGWLDGDRPWQHNTLVQVRDAWARFDGEYLIAAVRNTLDSQGELTRISVVPPDAYKLLPQREVDPEGASDE